MQQIHVTTTIGYANTVLTNASYQGPGTTKAPTGQAKQYAIQLKDILDNYKWVPVTEEVVDMCCSQR
jgi:hypothetical protein